MAELRPGDKAPAFELPGNGGQMVSLSSYKGSPVVLFFYPKDDTSGCTIENRDFTALADEFKKAGIVVIGMSPDSPKSHDKFAKKHELDVILASDDMKRMNVDQLDDAYRLDLVNTSTLVWKTGMDGWPRLGSIAGIDDWIVRGLSKVGPERVQSPGQIAGLGCLLFRPPVGDRE